MRLVPRQRDSWYGQSKVKEERRGGGKVRETDRGDHEEYMAMKSITRSWRIISTTPLNSDLGDVKPGVSR